ncbi:MAG TPA: type I DNA topoisomerase [Gemmatimonadaceae bacterium]|nr:type I DNA topoisomerase [Gemmatimonadaceae bacterium]
MPAKKKPAADKEASTTRRIAGRGASARPAAKKKSARRGATGAASKGTAAKGAAAKGTAARGSAAKRVRRVAAVETEGEEPSSGGTSSLVIVESPAKARTIGKYLGRGYRVKATVGHVRDLPEKKLGIDLDNEFEPEYVTIARQEKTLAELKAAAREAQTVYVATDPDREGEAIGWHVAEALREGNGRKGMRPSIRRVLFHEITKDAVRAAMERPRDIDMKLVDAQQARRLLDRLVGYKASPLLWKTVKKGLSAGRVQTVALRLIVEREREIRAFKPQEYWSVAAQLEKGGHRFTAKLHAIDEKKVEIPDAAMATGIVDDVTRAAARLADSLGKSQRGALGVFPVTEVKRRERRKNPAAPFTTSTLQQEAAKKLGFGSKRTMRLAQDLYEGIELGKDEGAVGLITYMRTDSTRVAESAALQAREVVERQFGKAYLSAAPQLYGTSGARGQAAQAANTQDAHESVRPTDPTRHPDQVRKYLKDDQFKLYQLIWQRFMASQMAPAVFDTTTIDFKLGGEAPAKGEARAFLFRATGSVVKFPGFLALYREAREEGDGKALEDEQALPAAEVGERIPLNELTPNQHFTEPPPRYSEASLVKELERLGIGRPSTYASIISVLAERRYVLLEQRRFTPTSLGESVEKVMVKQFPDVFDVGFTSDMEVELDKIEDGSLGWRKVLTDFWRPFEKSLDNVDVAALIGEAHDLSALAGEKCPKCGGKLVPKGGFFGPFVACVNHPKTCDYTRPVSGERQPAQLTEYLCHECGAPMVVRHGRTGDFLGCSRFPKCRGTRSMPTGVRCPKDGGEIAQRRSKARGKTFFGCENYPNCDFVVWDRPVPETCPECGYVGAEAKSNKTRGEYRRCLKCQNEWDVVKVEEEAGG